MEEDYVVLGVSEDVAEFHTVVPIHAIKAVVMDREKNEYMIQLTGDVHLQRAGADALLVTWLKTVNSNYTVLSVNRSFDPHAPNTFTEAEIRKKELPYRAHVADSDALTELQAALDRYRESRRNKKAAK